MRNDVNRSDRNLKQKLSDSTSSNERSARLGKDLVSPRPSSPANIEGVIRDITFQESHSWPITIGRPLRSNRPAR